MATQAPSGLFVTLAVALAAAGCSRHAAPKAPPKALPEPPSAAFAPTLVGPAATTTVRLAQTTPLGRLVANTADLATRCPGAQQQVAFDSPAFEEALAKSDDRDGLLVDHMLELNYRRGTVGELVSFMAASDYYAHRTALQARFEQRIAALADGAARLKALEAYAYALLHLGEFRKIVDRFAPQAAEAGPLGKSGPILFVLGQALFRLGDYAASIPVTRRAFVLMPEAVLDTRWQLMMSEAALYGWDLDARHSRDVYSTAHIKELFPNDDFAALPFEDATGLVSGELWGGTGSVSFADLDGDGFDDLVFEHKFSPWRVLRNVGGQRFVDVPRENVPSSACDSQLDTIADVDGDGRPDIYRECCSWDGAGARTLLRNDGGLRFSARPGGDATTTSGAPMVAAWADFDLDGHIDLVVNEAFGPTKLFRNQGDGTFVDVTRKAGIVLDLPPDPRGTLGGVGSAWGDFNDDRYPDLFLQGWGWKRLYRNKGDGTFEDVTTRALTDSGQGRRAFMAFFLDADNDGRLDLFAGQYVVSEGEAGRVGPTCTCSNLLSDEGYSEREWLAASTIFHNNGDGTFKNLIAQTKFIPLGTMGQNAADWDNDGDQDIVMGTGGPFFQQAEPTLFYENNGDGTFTNKTPFPMMSLWGKGHGVAFSDFDHDGDLDLFLNSGGPTPGDAWPSRLLRNRGNRNHWLQVRLKAGPGTNRLAIGAKVRVFAGKLTQLQELSSGGRFSGTNSFELHFGLGAHALVDRLEVEWPNRKLDRTVLEKVAVDQAIEISEADGAVSPLWKAAPR